MEAEIENGYFLNNCLTILAELRYTLLGPGHVICRVTAQTVSGIVADVVGYLMVIAVQLPVQTPHGSCIIPYFIGLAGVTTHPLGI